MGTNQHSDKIAVSSRLVVRTEESSRPSSCAHCDGHALHGGVLSGVGWCGAGGAGQAAYPLPPPILPGPPSGEATPGYGLRGGKL